MSDRPCMHTFAPESYRALDRCRCGHYCSDHERPPVPIDHKAENARLRAENATLLARAEEAERERDAARDSDRRFREAASILIGEVTERAERAEARIEQVREHVKSLRQFGQIQVRSEYLLEILDGKEAL